jgi:hypothetical protein
LLLETAIDLVRKKRRESRRILGGGRCEIRTHERLASLPVFKTGALNRSANLPTRLLQHAMPLTAMIRKEFYPAVPGLETEPMVPYSNKAVFFDRDIR